jgi:hypothetical protein
MSSISVINTTGLQMIKNDITRHGGDVQILSLVIGHGSGE